MTQQISLFTGQELAEVGLSRAMAHADKETWKPLVGFEDRYQVSDQGNVKAIERIYMPYSRVKAEDKKIIPERELTKKLVRGYPAVQLWSKEQKVKQMYIHRAVAITFIPNPDNKPEVNHINGNKFNNYVANLEWVTHQENTRHAGLNSLMPHGDNHPRAKLREQDIFRIFEMKKRGLTGIEIAREFGVYKNAIYNVLNGVHWRRVSVKHSLL